MKKYLVASTLLLSSFTSPIFAEEPKSVYFSLGGGVNFISDFEVDAEILGENINGSFDTNSPFQWSLAIGKKFEDWRLEFNYSAFKTSSDSLTITAGGNGATVDLSPELEMDVSSYMIYAYKDFPSDSKFTPYIGGGIGYSQLDVPDQTVGVLGVNIELEGGEEQLFTFGLKGGVDYEIAENTSLYSEVGYVNLASFTTDAGEEYDSNNSFIVSAGLRFSF